MENIKLYKESNDRIADLLLLCEDSAMCLYAGTYIKSLEEQIKSYKDLEEQGKLLKLPCAVGDAVYEICEGFIEPCTVEVIFLADYKDKDGNHSYMMEIHYDREDCPWVSTEVYFTDIGKTVFLTKEAAESALKEMSE